MVNDDLIFLKLDEYSARRIMISTVFARANTAAAYNQILSHYLFSLVSSGSLIYFSPNLVQDGKFRFHVRRNEIHCAVLPFWEATIRPFCSKILM